MTLSAWWLLPLAIPVLLLGEFLIARLPLLARFDLPVPIVGGLVIAGALLIVNCFLKTPVNFTQQALVSTRAWTWLVQPEPLWRNRPTVPIYLPFSTAFFTCVGLNASWSIAKRGGWQMILLLVIATGIGVVQNIFGVAVCKLMHVNLLLGLICGSVTLTGGPSTAMGMSHEFELAGFSGAGVAGAAAAMFGIVAASLLAGWAGGQLIRTFRLRSGEELTTPTVTTQPTRSTFFQKLRSPLLRGRSFLIQLLLVLLCVKLGAWVSLGFGYIHVGSFHPKLPVYIGAMVVGLVLRNSLDAAGVPILSTPTINALAGVALALFLAMAITSLDFLSLRRIAGPMLVILSGNTVITILCCVAGTFVLMGRDYDAAVTTAGNIGFSLGITPNAVATMDVLEQKFGPSTEAVLIVTLVGGFLIDLTNALIITAHLDYLK